MSALTFGFFWCLFQVTLLAAIGIFISLAAARKYPMLATSSVATVFVMISVATLLIPIQFQHWSLPRMSNADNFHEQILPGRLAPTAGSLEKPVSNFSIDIGKLVSQAKSIFHEQKQQMTIFSASIGWVQSLFAVLAMVGIVRFTVAILAVSNIKRSSLTVDDIQANKMLDELVQGMSCTNSVRLCTSPKVQSPAVLGWLRPSIILPAEWEDWEPLQLRVVLAHELAHIKRRDFFWRALATGIQAIHFYHPLTHWLSSRLTYSQELAADQLAARTLGSRTTYSHVLSQLAIRQDDLLRLRAESLLLPTLSSHLIRRIKMLRAKECLETGKVSGAMRIFTIGFILTVGLAVIAMRGLAATEDSPSDASTTQTLRTEQAEQMPQFARPPIDLSLAGENEEGVFVINVSELLKTPAIAPYLPALNTYVGTMWKACFPLDNVALPNIDLNNLDYIAGQAVVGITPKSDEQMGNLQLGSSYVVVRFRQEIPKWKNWLNEHVAVSRVIESNNATYIELPAIPAIAPSGLHVTQIDSHSLMLAWSTDLLEMHLPAYRKAMQSSAIPKSIPALHTGLACLRASLASSQAKLSLSSITTTTPENRILTQARSIGWDIDWSDDLQTLGIRLHLICEGQTAARDITQAIQDMAKTAKEELLQSLEKLASSPTPEEGPEVELQRKDALLTQQLLDSLEIQNTDILGKTKQVEVRFQLGYSLTELLDQMTEGLPASDFSAKRNDTLITK